MGVKVLNTRVYVLISLLMIAKLYSAQAHRIKLTNIVCKSMDEAYAKFETCRLRAESRSLQYYTIYLKFLKVPINYGKARVRIMKRANGYKPYLYDVVIKCDFEKHLNPLTKFVWEWFAELSNFNHGCPLDHDYELKRFENRFLERQLSVLPIINGDYALYSQMFVDNETKFTVDFYATFF